MDKMLEEKNGKIYTYTEYNKEFIKASRNLGGKWDKENKSWVFPSDIKEEVENILYDFYGYGNEKVDVKIKWVRENWEKEYFHEVYAGTECFQRLYNDYSVRIHDRVSILKGDFASRGGTRSNPQVGEPKSEVLEFLLRSVPKNRIHELDNQPYIYEIIKTNTSSKYSGYTIIELQKILEEVKKEIKNRKT